MKVDGHCHCGEITFEAEGDPTAPTICHCTGCQTRSRGARPSRRGARFEGRSALGWVDEFAKMPASEKG
jgi:hypothetical protein